MKLVAFILFMILLPLFLNGQIFIRQTGENNESLIARTLDKNSFTCGIYEYTNDSGSVIIYFQICNSTELLPDQRDYQETKTLFNVLFSTDKINYTKYIIDTLGMSTSCWAPATADSILFLNVDKDANKEICIILYPVPYCDNLLSTIDILFFDDLNTFYKTKIIEDLSELNFKIFEVPLAPRNEIKNKIISSLKSKGLLKE